MKKSLRVVAIACLLAFVCGSGCREDSPSQVVETYLRAVENGDGDAMKACLDETSQAVAVLAGMLTPEQMHGVSCLKALGERLEGDHAVVEIEDASAHAVIAEFILKKSPDGTWKICFSDWK